MKMRTFEYYRKSEIAATILMWMITIGTGIYILVKYPDMPDVIPTHFGLWGEPDAWGKKSGILIVFGIQIVIVIVEQWALHVSIKSALKAGNPSMINRDCMVVTGPFVSGLFGWCVVGTVWLGRLGKYFVFVTLALVIVMIAVILVDQKKDRERIREFREEEEIRKRRDGRLREERRDDTLGMPELKFQGKVDWWMWLLVIFINVMVIWPVIFVYGGGKEEITSAAISCIVLILVDLLILPMCFRNYILLGDEELLIVFGFIRKRIRYHDITLLEGTHNPLSSLAMSLDRIYIHTSSGDDVLVAVKEKQLFIEEVNRRAGI